MESFEGVRGTIIGMQAGCVVVRCANGDKVLCGGLKDLHQKWGFFSLPIGQSVRISGSAEGPKGKRPRIIEIVCD